MKRLYQQQMRKAPKSLRLGLYAVLGLLLLFLPKLVTTNYGMGIISRILLYAILAGSLNMINGYTNQFSIGHAGFFAIGAYALSIITKATGLSFWLVVPIAGLITAFIGLLVSMPTYRMRGIYLSIVTLGFSEIIRLIALNWTSLTGGPLGIKDIPAPIFFGMAIRKASHYYYIFLFFALLFLWMSHRVLKSRVGRAFMAIREDQQAAQSLGVEITKYKALNFMYGSFWAGIAGAIYAPYLQFIDSTIFTIDEGFNILSMVIVGGMGTLAGPVAGSIAVNGLNELLRPISQYRLVAYGILIIAMMWLRPQGIAGQKDSVLVSHRTKRRKKRKGGGK